MEKYALIGGDIHKLVRIPTLKDTLKYAWYIHYSGEYYFVPVRDECKHGYEPPRSFKSLIRYQLGCTYEERNEDA